MSMFGGARRGEDGRLAVSRSRPARSQLAGALGCPNPRSSRSQGTIPSQNARLPFGTGCLAYPTVSTYVQTCIQCVWMLRLHRVTWSFLSVFSIDGAVDKAGVRQPTFPIGFAGDSVWYPAPILEFIWQFMRDIYSTFQTSFGPISPLLLVACEVFFLDNVKILGYDILLHCCSRWINLKVDCSCLLSP
jgi:hypothetical protein